MAADLGSAMPDELITVEFSFLLFRGIRALTE
nr:MAG TPA: hypothetical protein [Caudoviricetes sp.]